ncbi:MAG: 2-aminoethylphosphonate--pyruvate transaminase [Pseudomonadota bacterium]|nr:2-aminoethylphosphonate--pyruvate transaminase [Pseudomonadota bacterium]
MDQDEPLLLTPGPLTTSRETKAAMLRDWGSRDTHFIALNARVCERLVALAGGQDSHVCVPVQGSGTFAVEATVGTLLPRGGKMLVLVNGAYGKRIEKICQIMGRACTTIETPEDVPNDPAALDSVLASDPDITHVAAIHCETTSGILNPITAVAEVTAGHGRRLIIDAMSAFGAIPLDVRHIACDAVVASSNKCLEGVPGMGFAIIRQSTLEAASGNAHSLSLDLHAQWVAMEGNGQWRFTPPTHVLAAFDQAIAEHTAEGSVAGRGARYEQNCRLLVEGMRDMGFVPLLPDGLQAPIIVTFHSPADDNFDFAVFYDHLRRSGYAIYPGKLTVAETFRIGCIGQVGEDDIRGALAAVKDTLSVMGVDNRARPWRREPSINQTSATETTNER